MFENEKDLAIAIVRQAAEDYTEAVCKIHKYQERLKEVRQFLASEEAQVYVSFDPDKLIKKLDEEILQFDYNLKNIKSSHHNLSEKKKES